MLFEAQYYIVAISVCSVNIIDNIYFYDFMIMNYEL
jgi:hypothetical protein